jgi:hypothetical protein
MTAAAARCPKCKSDAPALRLKGCIRTANPWHDDAAEGASVDPPPPAALEMVEMHITIRVQRARLSYGRWWVEFPSGSGRTWSRRDFKAMGLTPPEPK